MPTSQGGLHQPGEATRSTIAHLGLFSQGMEKKLRRHCFVFHDESKWIVLCVAHCSVLHGGAICGKECHLRSQSRPRLVIFHLLVPRFSILCAYTHYLIRGDVMDVHQGVRNEPRQWGSWVRRIHHRGMMHPHPPHYDPWRHVRRGDRPITGTERKLGCLLGMRAGQRPHLKS